MYKDKKNRSASFSSDVIMPNLFISYCAVVSAPSLLHRLKDFYTPVKRRVVLWRIKAMRRTHNLTLSDEGQG